MSDIKMSAPHESEAPGCASGAGLASTCYNNCSANKVVCKPILKTLSGKWSPQIKDQLQVYLNHGLVPIPLRGKIPQVKWTHGWDPKSLSDLESHSNCTNWGVRTGGNLGVIDFDSPAIFAKFAADNIDSLPDGLPLVKTGRGYHLWFQPTEPLKDAHYEGVDIKGLGGQVVAPPSIHPVTNRPYRFLWELKDSIPSLDLRQLKLPVQKKVIDKPESANKVKDSGSGSARSRDSNSNIGCAERARFDFSLIKDGVGEGQRHSSLVSYVGHLIWRGLTKQEIQVLALDWNTHNKPPLAIVELTATVNYCFDRYSKDNTHDNKIVPIKTHNKLNSVMFGTKPSFQASRSQRSSTSESTDTAEEPVDPAHAWDLESDKSPYHNCGQRRSILRKANAYLSVSFFCGAWHCPRCGPFFRRRWIEHLTTVTEGVDLFVTEIDDSDWARVRRAINRLAADYVKIAAGMSFKIITSKPLDGSQPLKHETLQSYLETSIPSTADRNPISTSRGWQHHKSDKQKSDYEAVAITYLPLKDQLEVAVKLGAKKLKYNRWISPQDVDASEWAERFKEGIWLREKLINWWMKQKDIRADMGDYLNEQWAKDAANDAYAKDNPFDYCIFEE